MNELRPDALLAIEPGDRVTEAARHRKFRREWLGRDHPYGTEWFNPSRRLDRYVARLARYQPTPVLESGKVIDMQEHVPSTAVVHEVDEPPRLSHGGLLPDWWPIAVVVYGILCGALVATLGVYLLPFVAVTLITLFFFHGAMIERTYHFKRDARTRKS
jgi:hypothetical protein